MYTNNPYVPKARIPITFMKPYSTVLPGEENCTMININNVQIPQLIAFDEAFTWIYHSPVCPNVVSYRFLISNYGRVYDRYTNRILNVSVSDGYYKVSLLRYISPYQVKWTNSNLHRLVLYYFNPCPGCENLEVNHKDGNKANNHISNLEWATGAYNIYHSRVNGLNCKGEDKPNAVLTNEQAEDICKLLKSGMNCSDIARKMNIKWQHVYDIKRGYTFRFISERYGLVIPKAVTNYLTDDQVEEICRLLFEGVSNAKIAEMIGCTIQQIKDIRYSNTYSHITKKYDFSKIPEYKQLNRNEESKIRMICSMIQSRKYNCQQIADMCGVSHNTVVSIKNREYYTDISKDYDFPDKKVRISTINTDLVKKICEDIVTGKYSAQEIADRNNVSIHSVYDIKRGRSFKDISSNYNIELYNNVEEDSIIKVCQMLQDKKPVSEIIKATGISKSCIYHIKNRERHTEISKDYNF